MTLIARSRRRKLTGSLAIVAAACCVGSAVAGAGLAWRVVDGQIRREFPKVPRISTAELATWLQDAQRAQPLLLDVRTRAEYEVSHLPGAVHVSPDAPAETIHEAHDRPIVTYCSVGYRSGAFAQRLIAAGYTRVANLEGSIFQWANEGRRVVNDRGATEKVHPYNAVWGLLLDSKYRADTAVTSR